MNTLKTLLELQKQVNLLVAELSAETPKKTDPSTPNAPKRGRGRPRKIPLELVASGVAAAKAIEETPVEDVVTPPTKEVSATVRKIIRKKAI